MNFARFLAVAASILNVFAIFGAQTALAAALLTLALCLMELL